MNDLLSVHHSLIKRHDYYFLSGKIYFIFAFHICIQRNQIIKQRQHHHDFSLFSLINSWVTILTIVAKSVLLNKSLTYSIYSFLNMKDTN